MIAVRRERTTAMERGGNFIAKVVYTLDQPPRKRLILVAPSSFRARLSVYSAAVLGETPRSNDFYPSHQNLKRGDNGEPPRSARRSRSERASNLQAADIGCAQFFPSPTLRLLRGCSRRAPRSNDFYPSHQNLNAEIAENRRGVRGDLAPKRRRNCERLILVAPSSFRTRLSVYSAAVLGELRVQ